MHAPRRARHERVNTVFPALFRGGEKKIYYRMFAAEEVGVGGRETGDARKRDDAQAWQRSIARRHLAYRASCWAMRISADRLPTPSF